MTPLEDLLQRPPRLEPEAKAAVIVYKWVGVR